MKIIQKLTIWIFSIFLIVGVLGYFSLKQLNRVAYPLNKDIPESIKSVKVTSNLDALARFIRYYDEVLTQSARNYAFTGDKKWEERYRSAEPKLDKIIKEAIKNGDEKDKEFFVTVDQANIALVELEYKSIELVNNKQAEKAVRILESDVYWDEKLVYEQGLRDYVQRRNVKYDEALLNSTKIIELATRGAQKLIRTSTQLVLIFTIAVLIFSIGISIYIARSISNPITKLRNSMVEISKGKLETKIMINSKDEIGQLAASFNKMVEDLRKTTVSKHYADSIIDNMMDSLIIVYPNGKVRTVNKATLDLLGYKEDEILNRPVNIIFEKESFLNETDFINLIRQDAGAIVEKVYVAKDGKEIPVLFTVSEMFDFSGNLQGIICIALDLTERKNAEERLGHISGQLEISINQMPIAYILWDRDIKVLEWNRAAEKIFGYTKDEIIGKSFFDAIVPKNVRHHFDEVSRKLFSGIPSSYAEANNNLRKDRELISCHWYNIPLYNTNGNIFAVLSMAQDITEHIKMENEVLRAQKLESLGILAGGIAHDFNNILTAILGNTSLAMLLSKGDGKIYSYLANVKKATGRAKDLTLQLLTFSKGGDPVKKPVSISELLIESAKFATRGSNARCMFNMAHDLWPVNADEGQINQVINNLVINAMHAIPDGGTIEICAENVDENKSVNIPQLNKGKYINIAVKDNGIGISKDYLLKIFDPYFTTKQKGSGLGLASAYSIIKKHEGLINVESEVGVGTIFNIYLPASFVKIVRKEEEEADSAIAGQGMVLVMDDDEMIRDMAHAMLTSIGYKVECVKDGGEAIDTYKKAKEYAEHFDVVLMDLTIPGGMGGKEAIKKLREIDPEAKVIVYSGYSNDHVMANFQKYGFNGVICKPFKIQEMNDVLQKVING